MQVEKLKTIDADTLLSTPMRKTLFVVDGLIPQGLSVLSGSSKIGKSWLMLWLGIQVARGQPVWEFETHKSDVLYLCLEDTYARIQSRLYQITDEAPPELRIATTSFQIANGLEQQIEQYLSDFPKTKLVIIDTFQKVRDSKSTGGKSGMYAGDYDDVTALKNISDKYGIAVVVVHHVRKLKDVSDPFNEVSGSTGITGAADTNFVLKRSRANETGTLLATGRDIAYQELTLKFDNRSHLWELVERKDMEDIHREEIPKFIFRLVDYISEIKEWRGTATQLITQVNETEVTPNVVTKILARFSSEVFQPQGIEYKTKRTGTSRLIYLKKMTAMTAMTINPLYRKKPSQPSLSSLFEKVDIRLYRYCQSVRTGTASIGFVLPLKPTKPAANCRKGLAAPVTPIFRRKE